MANGTSGYKGGPRAVDHGDPDRQRTLGERDWVDAKPLHSRRPGQNPGGSR
jgi:hypothetical protein